MAKGNRGGKTYSKIQKEFNSIAEQHFNEEYKRGARNWAIELAAGDRIGSKRANQIEASLERDTGLRMNAYDKEYLKAIDAATSRTIKTREMAISLDVRGLKPGDTTTNKSHILGKIRNERADFEGPKSQVILMNAKSGVRGISVSSQKGAGDKDAIKNYVLGRGQTFEVDHTSTNPQGHTTTYVKVVSKRKSK